jgi:RNA polymerase-binding transcription factor DksA
MDDREYEQLRRTLQERRDQIHRRLRKIHSDRRREDGPLDKDPEDQAIELENDEVLNQLEPTTRQELSDVMAALERMEEGTYGECIDCRQTISTSRLKAIPETRRCIECAEEAEMES